MNKKKKVLIIVGAVILALWVLSWNWYGKPEKIEYGVSFSKFHSDELNLDWRKTYLAILDELKVRNLRLSAHWPMIEPKEGKYNFSELDYQMREAEKRNASVILGVGHRLPGWPECHAPDWVEGLSPGDHEPNLLKYVETVVNRYKNSPSLRYWQIEKEVFLMFFSRASCKQHNEISKELLKKEIALVRWLDPAHPILITDSGELGTWFNAYKAGDVFGTSLYLYVWNQKIGPFKYPLIPTFFKIKHNLVRFMLGDKPAMIIELSSEPWLLQPIITAPIDVQLDRMGIDKLSEMIDFSSKTGFDMIYLWGAEWWYWLKLNGYSEHWERAQELFTTPENL